MHIEKGRSSQYPLGIKRGYFFAPFDDVFAKRCSRLSKVFSVISADMITLRQSGWSF